MRDWPLMLIVLYATLMVTISYSIVCWTSFKVWKHLKAMEGHMSVNTKDVNRQMTLTLIIQAILPLLTLLCPIAFTAILLFSRITIEGFEICISLLLSTIPIVNSLTTIYVVKPYRNAMLKIICIFSKKYSTVNAAATTSNIPKETSLKSQTAATINLA
uniref:G protein-coupled receptor n=1 Tax=Panagrolaimus sp. PS1159 TaxID=55785 RepID=A0AC35FDY4_9BILA